MSKIPNKIIKSELIKKVKIQYQYYLDRLNNTPIKNKVEVHKTITSKHLNLDFVTLINANINQSRYKEFNEKFFQILTGENNIDKLINFIIDFLNIDYDSYLNTQDYLMIYYPLCHLYDILDLSEKTFYSYIINSQEEL